MLIIVKKQFYYNLTSFRTIFFDKFAHENQKRFTFLIL